MLEKWGDGRRQTFPLQLSLSLASAGGRSTEVSNWEASCSTNLPEIPSGASLTRAGDSTGLETSSGREGGVDIRYQVALCLRGCGFCAASWRTPRKESCSTNWLGTAQNDGLLQADSRCAWKHVCHLCNSAVRFLLRWDGTAWMLVLFSKCWWL